MFGERLRKLIKDRRLTLKEFGTKFSLAESTISGYVNETRKPDIDLVNEFADFFDVSIDYLMGRVDDPKTILSEKERKMYDAVGDMSFEEQKKIFDFKEAEEEDIKDIIKQIELIKIRRNQIKSRG